MEGKNSLFIKNFYFLLFYYKIFDAILKKEDNLNWLLIDFYLKFMLKQEFKFQLIIHSNNLYIYEINYSIII